MSCREYYCPSCNVTKPYPPKATERYSGHLCDLCGRTMKLQADEQNTLKEKNNGAKHV